MTPKDATSAKKKNIEDATWYQKDFGSHIKKKRKEQKEYVAPEDVYNLNDDHTYNMLNERPGKYKGTPGAATVNLGREKEPGVIDVDVDEDNMSRASAMTGVSKDNLMVLSKDVLIQTLIKKGNISERVQLDCPSCAAAQKIFAKFPRGLRRIRDHRWKALKKAHPNGGRHVCKFFFVIYCS